MGKTEKIAGVNFLHRHITEEKRLGVDCDHVIVDKNDWELVVEHLKGDPIAMAKLCGEWAVVDYGVIMNGELKSFDVRKKLKDSQRPDPSKRRNNERNLRWQSNSNG